MRADTRKLEVPTEKDAAAAREFLHELEPLLVSKKDLKDLSVTVHRVGIPIRKRKVGIPEALLRSLLEVARLIAGRHPVAVYATDQEEEVSAQEAANFLRVSRPYVLNLVKKGLLPCRMVGTHHRIPKSALVHYKADEAPRRRFLEALTAETQQLGR